MASRPTADSSDDGHFLEIGCDCFPAVRAYAPQYFTKGCFEEHVRTVVAVFEIPSPVLLAGLHIGIRTVEEPTQAGWRHVQHARELAQRGAQFLAV
jgi:hypothetical protein